jgi:hypothetical protein
MASAIGKRLKVFTQLQTCLRKSLESEDFTFEVEKLNESLNSIKDKEGDSSACLRMDEARGSLNIYLT